MVFVDSTHEHRAVTVARDLPHVGRNVADREADAPVVRPVRGRAVDHPNVVQRHLAGAKQDIDAARLVDLDRDLLAARE